MEKFHPKHSKQSTKNLKFRSDKIFKMETAQASNCFKTEKKKRQARKLEWKKKKNHDCSYTTYCNTVLSPESRKMSTPQTIHKTVLIFRIHFVFYLHNFNEKFIKKSVIRN